MQVGVLPGHTLHLPQTAPGDSYRMDIAPQALKRAAGAFSSTAPRPARASSVRCVACKAQDASRPFTRRALIGTGLLLAGTAQSATAEGVRLGADVIHTEEQWKQLLKPNAYKVLRQASTELPFSSPLYKEKRQGTFVCAGCRSKLFSSNAKYESGTGWPSFYEALDGAVVEEADYSIPFMPRTEVHCKSCGGHLGHVFEDGPPPTNLRYCMNGVAMDFEPKANA